MLLVFHVNRSLICSSIYLGLGGFLFSFGIAVADCSEVFCVPGIVPALRCLADVITIYRL